MVLRYLTNLMIAFAILSFVSIAFGNVLLGVATALFFIYVYVYNNTIKIEDKYKGYFYAIFIFFITMLISALFSGDIKKGSVEWLNLCIWRTMPFLIITLAIRDIVKVKRVIFASFIGISIGFLCIAYQAFNGSFRAAGFYGHPMTFGGFLCVYLPVISVCFLERIEKKDKSTISFALLLALGLMAWLFNATRGAWVALTPVLLFILGYYSMKNKKIMVLCLIIFCVGGGYLINNDRFIQRTASIVSKTNRSNSARFVFWNEAIKIFEKHPFLGVGLGQSKKAIKESNVKIKSFTHFHSNIFQMLAENGLVGLIGYLYFVGFFFFKSFKDFLAEKCPLSLIIAMSTLALFIQGLTEYNFGNSAVMKAYWLVVGCILVARACKKSACK